MDEQVPTPIPPMPLWKKMLLTAVVSSVLTLGINQFKQFLPFQIDSATFNAIVQSIVASISF